MGASAQFRPSPRCCDRIPFFVNRVDGESDLAEDYYIVLFQAAICEVKALPGSAATPDILPQWPPLLATKSLPASTRPRQRCCGKNPSTLPQKQTFSSEVFRQIRPVSLAYPK